MNAVRDRLLDATEKLVYRHGIHATGVDAIFAEAGVAKMSLYKHFGSKDGLIAAMLERRHEQWMRWFTGRVESFTRDPAGRIVAIFKALGEWFTTADFHGCAFINAAAEEFDADHPVRKIAAKHKRELAAYLSSLVRAAKLPEDAATHLLLLIEGSIVTAMINHDARVAADGAKAASLILAAYGKKKPSRSRRKAN